MFQKSTSRAEGMGVTWRVDTRSVVPYFLPPLPESGAALQGPASPSQREPGLT
jgi:hypothetical protein